MLFFQYEKYSKERANNILNSVFHYKCNIPSLSNKWCPSAIQELPLESGNPLWWPLPRLCSLALTKSHDQSVQVDGGPVLGSGNHATCSHDTQHPSTAEPFHIPITSHQPPFVTLTARLFGLYGWTSTFAPEAITRWKIGHRPLQTIPSPMHSFNIRFPVFLPATIFIIPNGMEIHRISITCKEKWMYLKLGKHSC